MTFERVETDAEDYQGYAVINYPDESVPWTRIHEHKHFTPWEQHDKTVYFTEYSKETTPDDTPYYPKRLARDIDLLKDYRSLATKEKGVSFLGRLATYRYMDMEKVIGEALAFGEAFVEAFRAGTQTFPIFPNRE